jgi:hypothetical protein
MNRLRLTAVALALAMTGCVAATHQENAALRMPWPRSPSPALTAYAPPAKEYPSVGGDILKGASPADQAAARATASGPLTPP